MSNWLRQQKYAFSATFAHLRAAPGNFLLNMLVLGMTLSLPFAGLTILQNVEPLTTKMSVETEISVFVKMDVSRKNAAALAGPIRKIFERKKLPVRIYFTSKEKALERLKSKTDLNDVIAALKQNPLPDSYLLRIESHQTQPTPQEIQDFADQIKLLPHIEQVKVDSAWIKRLAALSKVLHLSLYLLGAVLSVVVVAVTFNTIRLQVLTHLSEIQLLHIVGATDHFIRQPFLYSGILLCTGAGAIALGVTTLVLHPLNTAIAELASQYASSFQLVPMSLTSSLSVLAISAVLGWMGAAFSIRKHLATKR